jgi:hypothetical protein
LTRERKKSKTLRVKTKLIITGLFMCSLMLVASCRSMLLNTPSATSLPVQTQAATTNTPNAVAWLELAKQANSAYNVTPYEAPVNTLLSGLIVLLSAASGWYARHTTAKAQIAAKA